MAKESLDFHRRDPIKSSTVVNIAGHRRRQNAVVIGKERREALVRTKRLCRVGISITETDASLDGDMVIDEEGSVSDSQTFSAIEELKSSIMFQGKGALQKKATALRRLRRLLSKSEFPPIEVALKSGAIPVLVQCLSFGSSDEQLLEAAWCLTNIAAGKPEETRALLPALPFLVAHLGEKSSVHVAEQCAWALGNVAGEGEELRNVLLSQGALQPLARMLLANKGSAVRTAAWALSNLIKGPNAKAANELIKVDGVMSAIIQHLKKGDDDLATEVAWLLVYLSALSDATLNLMANNNTLHVLAEKLVEANSLQLLIPVLRSIGNFIAGVTEAINIIIVGQDITEKALSGIVKCLRSEHRVLQKESAWVLSNIATMSLEHKRMIYSSEARQLLLHLLSTATFDIRKEAAYVLGNLCIMPDTTGLRPQKPMFVLEHLVSLVRSGCLRGFVTLVRSADLEAARLGLQFMELVLRGMPGGEGPKLVELVDGIDAMESFQFHENDVLRNMANGLVNMYFGENYGIDEG